MSTNKDGMATMNDWYSACQQFVTLLKTDAKLSQAKFLNSGLSGDEIRASLGSSIGASLLVGSSIGSSLGASLAREFT